LKCIWIESRFKNTLIIIKYSTENPYKSLKNYRTVNFILLTSMCFFNFFCVFDGRKYESLSRICHAKNWSSLGFSEKWIPKLLLFFNFGPTKHSVQKKYTVLKQTSATQESKYLLSWEFKIISHSKIDPEHNIISPMLLWIYTVFCLFGMEFVLLFFCVNDIVDPLFSIFVSYTSAWSAVWHW